MKKILFAILFVFAVFALNGETDGDTLSNAIIIDDTQSEIVEEPVQEPEITIFSEFIVASLGEKVDIVKKAPQNTEQSFFEEALNFALDNKSMIQNYPNYYPLILSTIKRLNSGASENIDDLLYKIYNEFSDYNIRLATLNALSVVKIDNPEIPQLIKDIVLDEFHKEDSSTIDIFISSINVLSNLKDLTAFDLLFDCYKANISEEVSLAACNAMYQLAPGYNDKLISIVKSGDLKDMFLAFNIATTNPQKDNKFTAEIAENVLSETIIVNGEVSELKQEQISLQLSAFKVLENAQWTKATPLVLDYFALAQKEYYALLIKENEFTDIIYALRNFGTTETCEVLTSFLASQYGETMTTGNYNHDVVLAVITTLGDLGYKGAFDTLLSVISCQIYPDDIIAASKEALEKLKWKF